MFQPDLGLVKPLPGQRVRVEPEDIQSLIHATALSQILLQTLESMKNQSLASDEFMIDLRGFCERGQVELASLRQATDA